MAEQEVEMIDSLFHLTRLRFFPVHYTDKDKFIFNASSHGSHDSFTNKKYSLAMKDSGFENYISISKFILQFIQAILKLNNDDRT